MSIKKLSILFYVTWFLSAISFSMPIWMIFMTGYQHFSISTAVNLALLIAFVMAIFEIWSGSWSDRFGRKFIFMSGLFLEIIATTIYIFGHGLSVFILSAVLLWLGYAMTSGNIEAIIHDNLEEMWKGEQFAQMQSNSYSFFFVWRGLAAILGWYLYSISPTLPYTANVIVLLLFLFIFFYLPKDHQKIAHSQNDLEHIMVGMRDIFSKKTLLYWLGLIILVSSFGNIYWYTYQEYFSQLWIPVVLFGWLYAILSFVSAFSAWLLGKYFQYERLQYFIGILMVCLIIAAWFLVFSHTYVSLIGIVFVWFASGWIVSLGNTIILQNTLSTHKSFVLSAFSFFLTIGYTVCSAIAWFFISIYWLHAVYMSLFPFFLIVFLFILWLRFS